MNQNRLVSLDAFRGITIAAMLLVNNPGSWNYVYPPLRHAQWHGWTPTDLVFPFFVFIVGVSVSLALSKRDQTDGPSSATYLKIAKRSIIIFVIGLGLNFVPDFSLAHLRIPGVLQRIAICYFISAVLFLKTDPKIRAAVTFACLTSYWLIMILVPVPGFGAGHLSLQGNLCSYVDTRLLAGHLYKATFDPEGFVSTLPAVATALIGTLAGDWLRSSKSAFAKTAGLFAAGIIFSAAGLALHPYFPINKQLWTSTFVLFTGGMALLFLALCYGLVDGLGLRKWSTPFLVLGTNAIAAYASASLTAKFLDRIKVSSAGQTVSAKEYFFSHTFVPWAGPKIGSLLFALLFVGVWILLVLPLYRKKIFIKI